TPTTPPIVSTAPIAVIVVIVSPRNIAPSAIEIRTASCEMTPTVIASTQRRLNVSSSCAAIAKAAVAPSHVQSCETGLIHDRMANGALTTIPKKQKLAYTDQEFSARRAARIAVTAAPDDAPPIRPTISQTPKPRESARTTRTIP